MREKIAKLIYEQNLDMFDTMSWEEVKEKYQGTRDGVLEDADQLLTLISKEVKKIKNPWGEELALSPNKQKQYLLDNIWEDCRKKILALFNP